MEKIAVVDDNSTDASRIASLAEKVFPAYEIRIFHDAESFIHFLQEETCLLVFLDLKLGNEDGMKLAERIAGRVSFIVFATSYTEKVFDAFRAKVIGFLSKSMRDEDLQNAMETLKNRWLSHRIALDTNLGNTEVNINSIMYAEKDDRVLQCTLSTGLKMTVRKMTLEELEEKAEGILFRINRSEIVNPDFINAKEKEKITMMDGKVFYVSRRKDKALQEELLRRVL